MDVDSRSERDLVVHPRVGPMPPVQNIKILAPFEFCKVPET
jgi:hypothetical protein